MSYDHYLSKNTEVVEVEEEHEYFFVENLK